ncbi:MAG TPA: SpoIIE family protein phosphatase [Bacteroidia bacterium]
MKINFFNTGFPKVTLAFASVIVIVLFNTIFNAYLIRKNKTTIAEMTEVINPYIESLDEFDVMITESKMYATNWVYLQNSIDDKKELDSLQRIHYPQLQKKLEAYTDKLNKQADKDSLQAVFKKFDELIAVEKGIMKTLVTFDDYENPQKKLKCEGTIEDEILPRTQDVMVQLHKIVDRNREEARTMKANIEKASKRMMTIMLVSSVGLFIFVFFAISFISGAIRKPVLKMKDIIQQLSKGELPEDKIETKDKNVVAEMAISVNALSESFTKTSVFANEIGKGNLTVRYDKLSDNDMLGNALINMRESLHDYSVDMENKVQARTQEVIEKSLKLEHAYREIKDSINYAKRIQDSILPANEMIAKAFNKSFIFYKPKDIVCGDFYWFTQQGEDVIIAVFDCTGHGVPGALMTVIGNSLLNQVVAVSGTTNPAKILDNLDKRLHDTLKQHGSIVTNDGMDAVVCRYRPSKKELTYAGAKRPLYMFKGGELLEIKGNKSCIGSFGHDSDKQFTVHRFKMNAGDAIYMFSDGVQDQFGGDVGKKFMVKRFRDLIVGVQGLSMDEQGKRIDHELTSWQGEYEQTDDMLCIGIQF